MRMDDLWVDGLTMMMDHMVDDEGAIVSIARHLKTKYDYDNSFYALSKVERTALEKRIEAEAEQLRDTRSLMALGKMDEKGRFSIEGDEIFNLFVREFQELLAAHLDHLPMG